MLVGAGRLTLRCRANEGGVTAFAGHAHAWITHAKVAKYEKDGLRREGSTGMMTPLLGYGEAARMWESFFAANVAPFAELA